MLAFALALMTVPQTPAAGPIQDGILITPTPGRPPEPASTMPTISSRDHDERMAPVIKAQKASAARRARAVAKCASQPAADMVRRMDDIPASIRTDVIGDGSVAEPDAPIQHIGVSWFLQRPIRRLVRAERIGGRWFVWLQYGRFSADEDEVLWFAKKPHQSADEGDIWIRTNAFQGDPCAAIEAFRAGLVNPFREAVPLAYKDAASGIVFVVGRDGRRVTAIGPEGKILWDVDPFADGRLEPYRTAHPVITYIGRAPASAAGTAAGREIGISFSSSQFGTMRIADGSFRSFGQD